MYPPGEVVYIQDPSCSTHLILFILGWFIPLLWMIAGFCLPANERNSTDLYFKNINKVLAIILLVLAGLAIVAYIVTAAAAPSHVPSSPPPSYPPPSRYPY
jgi:phage shock protein PspC (stress-responsive transcriptional regulator)